MVQVQDAEGALQEAALESVHARLLAPAAAASKRDRHGQPTAAAAGAVDSLRRLLRCLASAGAPAASCLVMTPIARSRGLRIHTYIYHIYIYVCIYIYNTYICVCTAAAAKSAILHRTYWRSPPLMF